MTDAAFGAWFLSSAERANRVTKLDAGKPSGVAWTEGNRVEPLVHGATYFSRLHHVLSRLGGDDRVHLTDWRGDWDERLDGSSLPLDGDHLARHQSPSHPGS